MLVRNSPNAVGVGDFDAEVGDFEIGVHAVCSLATRWVRMVPMPSMVETSSSPGHRNRGGVRVATDTGGGAGEDEVAGQQRRDR